LILSRVTFILNRL